MNVWSKFPFVRLVMPLMLGIVFSYHTHSDFTKVVPVQVILLLLPLLFVSLLIIVVYPKKTSSFKMRWVYGALLYISLFLSGYLLTYFSFGENLHRHFSNNDKNAEFYIATIQSQPKEKKSSYAVTLAIRGIVVDGQYKRVCGKVLAYVQKDSVSDKLFYGDKLLIAATFVKPSGPMNPEEFNYAQWLLNQGITHVTYLDKGHYHIIGHNAGNMVIKFAIEARQKFISHLSNHGIREKELPVTSALLTGYEELLDDEQRNDYAGSGVIHILSVSGLHAGIIYMLASFVLSFLPANGLWISIRSITIILIIWFYALFTGFASPVIRASVMFTIIIIADATGRSTNTMNTLAFAAFFMLVVNPLQLFNIGFQLSFSAVAGILLFYPIISNAWSPKNKIIYYLWSMTAISISAQIFTGPIAAYYFHQFPVYFLFANLIAIPLSGLAIYTGLLMVLFSFWTLMEKLLGSVLTLEVKALNAITSYIEGLPGALFDNVYLSFLSLLLLMLFLSVSIYWIYSRKKFYMFTGLITMLLLCLLTFKQYYITKNQSLLVVHQKYRNTLISLVSGHKAIILADTTICNDQTSAKYQLNNFFIRNYIRYKDYRSIDRKHFAGSYSLPAFYSFNGEGIVVLSGRSTLSNRNPVEKVRYVIVSDNCDNSLELIAETFPKAQYIADGSNRKDRIQDLKMESEQSGIDVHLTPVEGAFVAHLK